jgi:hypothetical protein
MAVVAATLLACADSGTDGRASPSLALPPTPTPAPASTSSGSLEPAVPPQGELARGERHRVILQGRPFTFSVPSAGWISNGSFGIDKSAGVGPEGAGFILWTHTPVGVFADPCAKVEGPPIGAATAELAAAVATVPGTRLVSGPTDVTIGGHPAKQVVLTIPEGIGCDPGRFYLWYSPASGARYATALGSTIRVWIVDVGGTPVWIDGETYQGAGPGPEREIQEIIDSIQFE